MQLPFTFKYIETSWTSKIFEEDVLYCSTSTTWPGDTDSVNMLT